MLQTTPLLKDIDTSTEEKLNYQLEAYARQETEITI
ncbi:hypothetical protein CANINC_001244, partial [Pichia inconspicua]